MIELRVFEDPNHWLWVEITSASSRLSRSLFVRAFWSDSDPGFIVNKSETITVEFAGRSLTVAYLILVSRRRNVWKKFRYVGALEDNPSRDVLNNILDLLRYY